MSDWWVETTLGQIADLTSGGTPSTKEPDFWGGDIVWLTPSEITKNAGAVLSDSDRKITQAGCEASSARFVPAGTVLVTSRATIGVTAIAGVELTTNQGFVSLIPGDAVNNYFLMYWVQSNKHEFTSRAGGSTFPEISRKKVASIPIVLPPVSAQERIVEVIGAVDHEITALEAEAVALEGVYRAATSLLWRTSQGDEAESRPLGDMMHLDIARTPMEAGTTHHLAGVLNSGKGLVDKGAFDGADTEYKAMNVLRKNQVVMRKLTAWEGPITVVPAEFDGFVASNEFPTFTLDDDIAPGWMKHVCRTPRLWAEMQSRVVGTVQRRKRLNPDQLLSVALPVPSRPEQEQTAEALGAIEGQIDAIRTEATRLRQARAGLLSGLLDRTIDIKPADSLEV
ncbi:restriction endonuclease subunit S [Streptomyces sp900116325]|uniref:restriction endonuclease subunit S n=1 Tax=Streptomyces sp. 900116325 TaxID=3154295 RepID=UPI0033205305